MKTDEIIKTGLLITISLLLLVISIAVALAWSPDEFCQTQANGSFTEYISCNEYFQNLSNPEVINTTITNNITQNNTFVVYNNITKVEIDEELVNVQIKKEVNKQLLLREIPEDFSQFITLSYTKDRYYLKDDVDAVNDKQDKEIESIRQAFTTLATELKSVGTTSEVELLKQQLANQQTTKNTGKLDNIYLLAIIGALALAGYFIYTKAEEKKYMRTPQSFSVHDSNVKRYDNYEQERPPKNNA